MLIIIPWKLTGIILTGVMQYQNKLNFIWNNINNYFLNSSGTIQTGIGCILC